MLGDGSLQLEKVEEGSIKLFIKGSNEKFEIFKELFEFGRLTEILGVQIESVQSSELKAQDHIETRMEETMETYRYPYRMFLSYASADYDIAKRLIKYFKNRGIAISWDQDIPLGADFSNTIKGLIAHSHIFIVLVSKKSKQRYWVNQETGFAIAKNIPVLILKISDSQDIKNSSGGEEEDLAMLNTLQSITISKEDDLDIMLSDEELKELVNPRPPRPTLLSNIVQWPEKRTEMLAEYANRELQFGHYGKVRQKATFSSFYLPAADVNTSIWSKLDGLRSRSKYFHHLLTEEREALERHARVEGCKLILDPTYVRHAAGKEAVKKRLEQVLNFLENISEDIGAEKVQVGISSTARKSNLTIVGDWFFAESQNPGPDGYRQTIFNFHAPTVYQKIIEFDNEFDRIQQTSASKLNGRSKLQYAIDEIKKAIEGSDK